VHRLFIIDSFVIVRRIILTLLYVLTKIKFIIHIAQLMVFL